jgi:hypothetical protein
MFLRHFIHDGHIITDLAGAVVRETYSVNDPLLTSSRMIYVPRLPDNPMQIVRYTKNVLLFLEHGK